MAPPATECPTEATSTLLSLSIAAASAAPIPIASIRSCSSGQTPSLTGPGSLSGIQPSSVGQPGSSLGSGGRQHRRLSSTGKARRRLSDARDAANRPSPAIFQNPVTLSLTSLSLSSSSPPQSATQVSTSFSDTHRPSGLEDDTDFTKVSPVPISNGRSGRKRGVDHKCESCSKIYRHPSCLIKHRWEHTPHWREASKFVLSKHQQVQLLEAAAILSHLSPSSSSLPEDRSLWPSFLSGGSLPKAEDCGSSNASAAYPISSSVPATGKFLRSGSPGPRLHDYSILSSATAAGVTQLRPGLLGVSTTPAAEPKAPSGPVPVPNTNSSGYRSASGTSTSWASSASFAPSSYVSNSASLSLYSEDRGDRRKTRYTGTSGWSLPRSSIRGSSSESRSRSRSGSGDDSLDGEHNDDDSRNDINSEGYNLPEYQGRYKHLYGPALWKKEEEEMTIEFSVREEDDEGYGEKRASSTREEEWDGLDMDMDMD